MANISAYKKAIRSFLSEKRCDHCVAVAKEAVRLAKKYGADPEKAETAGILHDIMKEASPDQQLKIITDFGIMLNDIELSTKKLWHQCAGMAYVAGHLGVEDQDVLNAIRYHTSGRSNMSLLEKVLFIADFTSRDRNYNGVENMRKLAETSLESAMIEGLSFTILELAEEKKPIIEDTIDAYNQAVHDLK